MSVPFDEDDDPLGLGPVDDEIARQREEGAPQGGPDAMDPLEVIRQNDPVLAEYLRRVDGDGADWDRPLDLLAERGVVLPPAEELGDAALTEKLWEVIWALADLGGYLEFTDHLSDRELYTRLRETTLAEQAVLMPGHLDYACHFDLSAEDGDAVYLRYYADEETRQGVLKDEPNVVLPPREAPPFPRDQELPRRPEPLWASCEDGDAADEGGAEDLDAPPPQA